MKNKFVFIYVIGCSFIFSISCKTKAPSNAVISENTNQTSGLTSKPSTYPTEPGTCVIQGYILNIIPMDNAMLDEPCKSFPCLANVIITKSGACGFGVYQKPVVGDTLPIKFIHSIASSEVFKTVYPAKVILPGLKPDQLFEAQIRIKLMPMDKLAYEVGDYELVR
jgi:hypothetical protein